ENLTGMWTFEDASYLEHAAVGLDLEPNNHPRRIVASVAGPKNTKAVRIGNCCSRRYDQKYLGTKCQRNG
ncbi:MAG: hypothetical protein LBQ01_01530, partial [Prevotellaceae bacterium]|nr:hypothetical protein [Prevotellaceae bacterium]